MLDVRVLLPENKLLNLRRIITFQTHLISQCDTAPLLSFMLHLRLGLEVILLVVVLPLSCNTILHIGRTGHFETVQLPGPFLTFLGPSRNKLGALPEHSSELTVQLEH